MGVVKEMVYNRIVWCGNQGTNKSNNPSIFRRGMCSCRQSARNLLFNCRQLPMPRDIPLLRLLGFSFCNQTSVKCCTLQKNARWARGSARKWQTARVDTCDSRVVWYKPAIQILQQDTSLVEIITLVMLVVLLFLGYV